MSEREQDAQPLSQDVEVEAEDTALETDVQVDEEGQTDASQGDSQDGADSWRAEWERTGDPKHLPPELQAVHKNLLQGWNKKVRELAEMRKSYERKLEGQVAGKESAKAEDGPPALDDSSAQALRESIDRLVEWKLGQKLEPVLSAQQRREQEQRQRDAEALYEGLTKREDYSRDIEDHMVQMVEEDPSLAALLQSKRGIERLFLWARDEVSAARAGADEARRKASLPKRTVTRPAGAGTKETTVADKYAGTFEEIARETAREMGFSW